MSPGVYILEAVGVSSMGSRRNRPTWRSLTRSSRLMYPECVEYRLPKNVFRSTVEFDYPGYNCIVGIGQHPCFESCTCQNYLTMPEIRWTLDVGHILTILVLLAGMATTWGATSVKLDTAQAQVAALEAQVVELRTEVIQIHDEQIRVKTLLDRAPEK